MQAPSPLLARSIPLLAYAAATGAVWCTLGVVSYGETEKYLAEAHYLLAKGRLSHTHFQHYALLIYSLAAVLKVGLPVQCLALVQWMVGAASVETFRRSLLHLGIGQWASVAASTWLATAFFYQAYHLYLYTESFYHSLLIFCGWLVATQGRRSMTINLLAAVALTTLLWYTRPTGLLVAAGLWAGLAAGSWRAYRKHWLLAGLVLAGVGIWLLNRVVGSGQEFNFTVLYTEAHVICGLPGQTGTTLSLQSPPNTLAWFAELIWREPTLVLGLAAERWLHFFGFYRSYFGLGHNLLNMLWFFPVYALAMAAWIRRRKWQPVHVFAFVVLLFHTLMAGLCCDDWHNRFMLGMLPCWLWLAMGWFAVGHRKSARNAATPQRAQGGETRAMK